MDPHFEQFFTDPGSIDDQIARSPLGRAVARRVALAISGVNPETVAAEIADCVGTSDITTEDLAGEIVNHTSGTWFEAAIATTSTEELSQTAHNLAHDAGVQYTPAHVSDAEAAASLTTQLNSFGTTFAYEGVLDALTLARYIPTDNPEQAKAALTHPDTVATVLVFSTGQDMSLQDSALSGVADTVTVDPDTYALQTDLTQTEGACPAIGVTPELFRFTGLVNLALSQHEDQPEV